MKQFGFDGLMKSIYGIISFKFAPFPENINLKRYFEKSLLKDKITAIFGGHIHTSMYVLPKKYAKQIVLGNSGTQLVDFKIKITKTMLESFSLEKVNLISNVFGYAVLKKISDQKWIIIFKNSDGKEISRNPISN